MNIKEKLRYAYTVYTRKIRKLLSTVQILITDFEKHT